jgi:methionyl-tRNA formyltransferase
MRIIFFGSGAFGLPTLAALHRDHEIIAVVSQPDRPAGRGRAVTPTPIAQWAIEEGLPLHQMENVNDDDAVTLLRSIDAQAWVVVAFGQMLSPQLLSRRFAINLHASLLPRHRGASPIHHAILSGDQESGVTVISLAKQLDVGQMYARASTPIAPGETAGELHDRLAELGPSAVESVLKGLADDTLEPTPQREGEATTAGKLSPSEVVLPLSEPASVVAAYINGLSPWPSVSVSVCGRKIKLLRAIETPPQGDEEEGNVAPPQGDEEEGNVTPGGVLTCGSGTCTVLDVQPAGKRPMSWSDFANGLERGVPWTIEISA